MFLAVWLVYAGDRLLDGLGEAAEQLEARHLFHRRHLTTFGMTIVAAASVALVPLVLEIPATMLRLYLGLAGLFGVWFTAVHLVGRSRAMRLPKELIPGAFCAAAAFIPIWAGEGFRHRELAFAAIAYGALVTLNCWFIFSFEHDDLGDADATTRIGVRWIRHFGAAAVILPLLAILLGSRELIPVFVAISLAAGLLMGLDRVRQQLSPTDLRAASDLVLLTPLLVAPFLR